MRKLFYMSFIFLAIGCQEIVIDPEMTIEELEIEIRDKYDSLAVFAYGKYEQLLDEISKEKYIVLPVNEFKDTFNENKVIVCMRHDVDNHVFKAIEMAEMEREKGLRTTYYILATGPYYGKFEDNKVERLSFMNEVYQSIHNMGHEIGIHNDLMAIMIKYKMDPFLFNWDEINFYKSLGIEIKGTAAHGSYIANQTAKNFEIFSDFAQSTFVEYEGVQYPIGQNSLAEFGFGYEAYFINNNRYFSESGGDWRIEGGFDGLLEKLENSQPGERIQILTHPLWWEF